MAKTTTNGQPSITGAGDVLSLIRSGQATTRADVAALTGWARSTVAHRVDALSARGLIQPAGGLPSTGGRPPSVLQFNADAGVVLAAEIGATHVHAAITDLAASVIADAFQELPAAEGPTRVLATLDDRFAQLLSQSGRSRSDLFGVGIGLASPVEFASGRPVNPPIMPGWDGFEVAAWMRERWRVPALVDNEVNMMAVGEHATTWTDVSELLCIKVGTGIGCGIVSRGEIHRGAQGAAGDIGHVRVIGYDDVTCHCGNVACLEAAAGGEAIARTISAGGVDAHNSRDVIRLVREGNRDAIQLVRQSGRLLGEVLAGAVNLLNPSVIVIGGDIAQAEEPLFAGVRESVYQRSLPLATKHLRIVPSQLADRAAVIGAAITVIEHTLSPSTVDAALAA
jgi:predicted NBD/HSP70 family sugar kinase